MIKTETTTETAVCRGCGRALNGKPFYQGGQAYHPETNDRCPSNYYGGFVCSQSCDRHVSLDMESSMPGVGLAVRLSSPAQSSLCHNWNK